MQNSTTIESTTTTQKPITVFYTSVDGYETNHTFYTIEGAQTYAQRWVGKFPELGTHYAISGDGIGKIEVKGLRIKELFPEASSELEISQEEVQKLIGAPDEELEKIRSDFREKVNNHVQNLLNKVSSENSATLYDTESTDDDPFMEEN